MIQFDVVEHQRMQFEPFSKRFMSIADERSPFCFGTDPSLELLAQWGLPPNIHGLRTFNDVVIEAASGSVAVVKAQSAFYERFGPEGMIELQRLGRAVQDGGSLFMIDCKRNDIGHTMAAYAATYFGETSPYRADAITASPYLGIGALSPLLETAGKTGSCVFVVVASSNPEGASLQTARTGDGRAVVELLADEIAAYNNNASDSIGPVGAVVGATSHSGLKAIVHRMPNALMLSPGIGAQGGSIEDLLELFGKAALRVTPTSSRGVLVHGPSVSGLKRELARLRDLAIRMRDTARRLP